MEYSPLELFVVDNLTKDGSSVYRHLSRKELVLTIKHIPDGESTEMYFFIPGTTPQPIWSLLRFLERIAAADRRQFVVTEVVMNCRGLVGTWVEGEDWEAFIAPVRERENEP